MHQPEHAIVVGLPTEGGEAALTFAVAEAQRSGSPIHLVHVLQLSAGEAYAGVYAEAVESSRTTVETAVETAATVRGLVERVGTDAHRAAFEQVQETVRAAGVTQLLAVGHRVVHGGERFRAPTVLDDEVVTELQRVSELAPLHNPPALSGIALAPPGLAGSASHRLLRHRLVRRPAGCCGDVRGGSRGRPGGRYPTLRDARPEPPVRRDRAARLLGRDPTGLRLITLHLGDGASAAAVRDGRPVDTSMGLTPLEGLVMGTRPGDLDPGVLLHLLRRGWDLAGLEDLCTIARGCKDSSASMTSATCARGSTRATVTRGRRTPSIAIGCASMSAPTWRCSVGPTRSCSPAASGRT